jgi:hypothetical protein
MPQTGTCGNPAADNAALKKQARRGLARYSSRNRAIKAKEMPCRRDLRCTDSFAAG